MMSTTTPKGTSRHGRAQAQTLIAYCVPRINALSPRRAPAVASAEANGLRTCDHEPLIRGTQYAINHSRNVMLHSPIGQRGKLHEDLTNATVRQR
jgi:hypothetical protein